MTHSGLYLPQRSDMPFRRDELRGWYANLLTECIQGDHHGDAGYSDEHLRLLRDRRNYYGKYLDPATREFFLHHFAGNLTATVNYLCAATERPTVLEWGSGCGNQLLLMALLGARVVGCDVRPDVCALVEARKRYYEGVASRALDLTIVCEDALTVDWSRWGPFDAALFQFSFNDIGPADKVLAAVAGLLKKGGRIALQEINPSNYFNLIARRRALPKPREIAAMLTAHGFRIDSLRGGYALPPLLWRHLPRAALVPIDSICRRSLFLSPSYHLLAEKE